jgi:hypothetical protein
MSFITSLFGGNTTAVEPVPAAVNDDYQTVLYPGAHESSTQTDDNPVRNVFVVIHNKECLYAYVSEKEAQKHVESVVSSLMRTDTYKMVNGRSIFIYSGPILEHKITYYSVPLELSQHMCN